MANPRTSWRNDDSKDVTDLAVDNKRLLLDGNQKYSKKCMKLKAVVLNDLISRFKTAKKNNKLDDDCEVSLFFFFFVFPEVFFLLRLSPLSAFFTCSTLLLTLRGQTSSLCVP